MRAEARGDGNASEAFKVFVNKGSEFQPHDDDAHILLPGSSPGADRPGTGLLARLGVTRSGAGVPASPAGRLSLGDLVGQSRASALRGPGVASWPAPRGWDLRRLAWRLERAVLRSLGAGRVVVPEDESPEPAPVQPDMRQAAPAGAPASPETSPSAGSTADAPAEAKTLQQRTSNYDFRNVLTSGLDACKRKLLTVALFSFWINTLILALPIYLFQISDRVLTSRSIDTLVMLSVIAVGAIFFHVMLDVIRRFMLMRIAVDVETTLGAPVLAAATRASQNGSSREFQTLADLQQLRNFITGPVLLVLLDAPVAPVYLLAVYLIHPDLGLIVTVTSLILITVAICNQKLTAQPFGEASHFASRANLAADAMARNAQVMNAMGMIPEGVVMWGKEAAGSLKAQVKAQDRNVVMAGLSKFVRLCTQITMLGWGAHLSLNHELTGGMVIAASIVSSRALAPVEAAIEGWRHMVQVRSAYARIRGLLTTSPLNLDRLRLPRPRGRLTVERILYVPPPSKKVILNGITFELQPGEFMAVVGPSGTGKSTLGRMLVGSITPTAGSVRLDMMDMRNWDLRQFGECVGYLPQDVQLFPGSIKANIGRMREDATDAEVFEAAELADVHEMISQLPQGYETPVAIDGSPLSGGQKQRIGLARAFFGDPRFVVLDEPNSNLDTPGEQALARALARAKKKGITVVAITQRPSLLQSVDKIMILKDGSVQALGPREEILPILSGKPPVAARKAEPASRSPDAASTSPEAARSAGPAAAHLTPA